MKRFVEGEDRRQSLLLPDSLDDYVTEDNPVRAVEVFIEELDLDALGFEGMRPAVTGRPAYHPSTLLKIYLYGYLNRVQSSRRLEREAQRNIELMWLTDPDARSMATSGRGTGMVGYNVQTAVDAEHHLIVAHEVTNQGHDRTQLQPMALKAQEATGCEEVTALADRGYFSGEQILSCEGTGIAPVVPKTLWPSDRGFFTRQDFIYDAEHDHYVCPAGAKLTRGAVRSDRKDDDIEQYRHLAACFTCPLKPRCTTDKLKRIKRWKHEAVLDKMQARLDRMPDAMGIRRQTVEHPFGTLKAWMGSTHFLTRTLEKVRTEMSLHVLAYNMKRMIKIFGVGPLMAAIRA
jgi:hypothetical protein